jgi:hypothetical protein
MEEDPFMKPQKYEYEGHRVELRQQDSEMELLIDGRPVRYGQLPDGPFYLHDYAYDWSDDLMEVARRYIDYLARVETVRGTRTKKKSGGK